MADNIDPFSHHVEKARRKLPALRAMLTPHNIEIIEDFFIVRPPYVTRDRQSVRWHFMRDGATLLTFSPSSGRYFTRDGKEDRANPKRACEIAIQLADAR